MTDLSTLPIAKQYPAQHPDRIQLYSYRTPNGVKISSAPEDMGLEYEPDVPAWLERVLTRPAIARGVEIPA